MKNNKEIEALNGFLVDLNEFLTNSNTICKEFYISKIEKTLSQVAKKLETQEKENIIAQRVAILKFYDDFIREEIGDEDCLPLWLAEGVPDECSEDFFREIAEDSHWFREITKVFAGVVSGYDY